MSLEIPSWISIVSVSLILFCYYFTLTFIESLHNGEKRITKQSKIAAIICLALALFILILG